MTTRQAPSKKMHAKTYLPPTLTIVKGHRGLRGQTVGPPHYGNATSATPLQACDHHYVRIGPYLKCTRCGDLKAAPQEGAQ